MTQRALDDSARRSRLGGFEVPKALRFVDTLPSTA